MLITFSVVNCWMPGLSRQIYNEEAIRSGRVDRELIRIKMQAFVPIVFRAAGEGKGILNEIYMCLSVDAGEVKDLYSSGMMCHNMH